MLFHFFCDCFHSLRILSESDSAFFDIRTGNIDFKHIHWFVAQPFDHFDVIFRCLSTDIDNNLCIILLQERDISFTEYINARILQTDGI